MTTYKIRRGREMRPKMKRLRGASAIAPAVAAVAVGATAILSPPSFGPAGRGIIRCDVQRVSPGLIVWCVVGLSCWLVGALTGTGLLSF